MSGALKAYLFYGIIISESESDYPTIPWMTDEYDYDERIWWSALNPDKEIPFRVKFYSLASNSTGLLVYSPKHFFVEAYFDSIEVEPTCVQQVADDPEFSAFLETYFSTANLALYLVPSYSK